MMTNETTRENVERLNLDYGRFPNGDLYAEMLPESDGDYVAYDDYAALRADLAEVKAREAKLRVDLAREKLDRLVEWLSENDAHGVWLIEAMDDADIAKLRAALSEKGGE